MEKSGVPGVTEEPVILTLLSPHQPLPEGGVVQHPAAVVAPQQERGELLHTVRKLRPLQRSSRQSARVYHLKQLGWGRGKGFQQSELIICQRYRVMSVWQLCGAVWGVHLLVGQWVKRRHSNVEQWQNSLKRRQGGKPHVELQQVDLCQAHRNHLQIQIHTYGI